MCRISPLGLTILLLAHLASGSDYPIDWMSGADGTLTTSVSSTANNYIVRGVYSSGKARSVKWYEYPSGTQAYIKTDTVTMASHVPTLTKTLGCGQANYQIQGDVFEGTTYLGQVIWRLSTPARPPVTINLSPAGAVAAGAQWKLTSGADTAFHASGSSITVDPGTYTVTFRSITGYFTPADVSIDPLCGGSVTQQGNYVPIPAVTVTSPNGGEFWAKQSTHAITATVNGSITGVTFEYSTNGGASWVYLNGYSTTTTSLAENWTLPAVVSSTCRVRVTVNYPGGTVADTSDANFTIMTLPVTPSGPSPVDSAMLTAQPNKLDWTDTTGATRYDLFARAGSGVFTKVGADLAVSEWSPGQTYNSTQFEWYVVAKNAAGSTQGPTWSFTSASPPTLSSHPRSKAVSPGQDVSFSVQATGTAPLTYQWHKDGVPISGANSSTYSITGVQTTSAGRYHVAVSNAGGNTVSEDALLILLPAGSSDFAGNDDFNNNSRDTTRWGSSDFGPAGTLVEANARLEFRSSTTAEFGGAWGWNGGLAPYGQDWAARVRVNLPNLTFSADGWTGVSIGVFNSADPGDRVFLELETGRYSGGLSRAFLSEGSVDDAEAVSLDASTNTTSTSATLRLRWDATTKLLHLEYDANGPANGDSWTELRTVNPATIWGMSSGSFLIAIGGYSNNRLINSGDAVWLDDFSTTISTITPTCTLQASANGSTPVLQPVQLTATMSAGASVNKIEFLVNGQKIWETSAAPYTATWLPLYYTTNQTIPLTAVATLAGGTTVTSSPPANVKVTHPIDDLEPKPLLNLPYGTARNPLVQSKVSLSGSIFQNLELAADEAPSSALVDIRVGNHTIANNGVTPSGDSLIFFWFEADFRQLFAENEARLSDLSPVGAQADGGKRFVFVAYPRNGGPGVWLPTDDATFSRDFPLVGSQFTSLQVPLSTLVKLGLGTTVSTAPSIRLFRKPNFSASAIPQRLLSLPQATSADLTPLANPQAGKKLIILVHGWNRTQEDNPYLGEVFLKLAQGMQMNIQGNAEWTLLGYDWSKDATTGGNVFGEEITFNVSEAGSRAAAMGYLHGMALGDYLKSVSGTGNAVSKIQFVAHSAGSWVVYGAMQKLMQLGGNAPRTQITLLDPYMASEGDGWRAARVDCLLGKRFFEEFAYAAPALNLQVLENYYVSLPDVTGAATRQKLFGTKARNADVTFYYWNKPFGTTGSALLDSSIPLLAWQLPSLITYYGDRLGVGNSISAPVELVTGHDGPIRWYADSISRYPQSYNNQFEAPKGWADMPMGWNNSLFSREYLDLRVTVDELLAGANPDLRPSLQFVGTAVPTQNGLTLGSQSAGTVSELRAATLKTANSGTPVSDSSVSSTVAVAAVGAIFSFDFAFDAAGAEDALVLLINGQSMWSYGGTNYTGQGLQGFLTTGPLDISAFAGQTVTWEIRLQARSGQAAVARVDNIAVNRKPFTLTRNNSPVIGTLGFTNQVAGGNLHEFKPDLFGPGPIALLWLKNGSSIASETNQTLSFTVGAGSAGSYQLRASNVFGTVTSAVYRLEVDATPGLIAITAQPTNVLLNAGQPASFTVTATGAAPLAYQWFKDGVELAQTTNTTLALVSADAAWEGLYWLRITNSLGQAVSAPARLELIRTIAPTISLQPISAIANQGSTVAFSVIASGNPLPAYQWRFNSNALVSATNAVLVLRNLQASQAGPYDVVITNSAGSITSRVAGLVVGVPVDTNAIVNLEEQSGWVKTQSAPEASGLGGNLVLNAGRLEDVDSWWSTYVNTNMALVGSGYYRWKVYLPPGSVPRNGPAVLWRSNLQPSNGETGYQIYLDHDAATYGSGRVHFSAVTNGNGTTLAVTNYVKKGVVLVEVEDTGARVKVRFDGQLLIDVPGVLSNAGRIGLNAGWSQGHYFDEIGFTAGLSILTHPQSQLAVSGSNATFSVTALGAGLNYQWRKGAVSLPGATNFSLGLTNLSRADAGSYSVTVGGTAGSLVSSNAILRVLVPQRVEGGAARRLSDGRFRLDFRDQDGALGNDLSRFEIHSTTNLTGSGTVWMTNIVGLVVTNGLIRFEDAGSTNLHRRFYRVIER